jgi:hypothetical protein
LLVGLQRFHLCVIPFSFTGVRHPHRSAGSSYDFKHKRVKDTKTERPREVPVHPTLAKVLAEWKLAGWQRLMGRAPKPEDLLVPASKQDRVHGLFRNPNEERKYFYKGSRAGDGT